MGTDNISNTPKPNANNRDERFRATVARIRRNLITAGYVKAAAMTDEQIFSRSVMISKILEKQGLDPIQTRDALTRFCDEVGRRSSGD